jgi:hypothetical protein
MDVYPCEPEMKIRSEWRSRTFHVDDAAEGIGFHHVFTLPKFVVPYEIWDQHFSPDGIVHLFSDICQLLYKAVKLYGRCCKDYVTHLVRSAWSANLEAYWQLPNFSIVDIYVTRVEVGKTARRMFAGARLEIDEFMLDSVFRYKETQLIVEIYFKLSSDWLECMIRSEVLSIVLAQEFVPRLKPYYNFPLILVHPE